MSTTVEAATNDPPAPKAAVDRHAPRRRRNRLADDRGLAEGVEHLFGALFLVMLFLFIAQVVVWWHARNIIEQSAAEGARVAAAADGSCGDAPGAAAAIAERIGGEWVDSLSVTCGGDSAGSIVTVRVTARTPAFLLPGSFSVSAVASAPEESP